MKQSEYRAQSRGGVGVSGMKTHADDDVNMIIPTFTHNYLMFFTNKGRVYSMKAYNIPEGSRTAKGTPIVNLLPLQENEHVQTITQVEEINDDLYLFFVTKRGTVKRTQMKEFANIRSTGIIAITLDEDDELFRVYLIKGNESIVLGASNGKAIRFAAEEIRSIGRSGAGVRGMLLGKEDEIVGCAIVKSEEDSILVVSQKGYGKRTAADEYRLQGRGGSGVKTMNVTEKNGNLVCLAGVTEDDDLIITTDRGVVIRMHCDTISQTKRATQGVKLISIRDNQAISTIAVVEKEDEELEEIENTEEVVTEILDANQENTEVNE
jgi:DNA gyrase subunit A